MASSTSQEVEPNIELVSSVEFSDVESEMFNHVDIDCRHCFVVQKLLFQIWVFSLIVINISLCHIG